MAHHHVEHLHSAEAVDDAIVGEASGRLVVVRFGRGGHADCARADAALAAAAERLGPAAAPALYAVDVEEVQDFNVMYQLECAPCTVMFFYENAFVRVCASGGRNIDWGAYGGDELAGVVRAVHERAKAGGRYFLLD
ncbi:hypothetical protein ACP4OV_018048 [Aristida adscensionis]